jgi:hypothetical protein
LHIAVISTPVTSISARIGKPERLCGLTYWGFAQSWRRHAATCGLRRSGRFSRTGRICRTSFGSKNARMQTQQYGKPTLTAPASYGASHPLNPPAAVYVANVSYIVEEWATVNLLGALAASLNKRNESARLRAKNATYVSRDARDGAFRALPQRTYATSHPSVSYPAPKYRQI